MVVLQEGQHSIGSNLSLIPPVMNEVDKYLNTVDADGFDPLGHHRIHNAAFQGDVERVKAQLDSGVDVDLPTSGGGMTPFMCACTHGKVDVARFLLERKANLAACTKDGTTALMAAASCGSEDGVKLLLELKADENTRRNGKTALAMALRNRRVAIVEILLGLGRIAAAPLAPPAPNPLATINTATTTTTATTTNTTDVASSCIAAT